MHTSFVSPSGRIMGWEAGESARSAITSPAGSATVIRPEMARNSAEIASTAMNERDARSFAGLFREAYHRCFSRALTKPLTEPESRRFSDEILEKTGLVVGWKSLKNYSHWVLETPQRKPENPSTATLDTLARYVLNAPATDELARKKHAGDHPFWFRYRRSSGEPELAHPPEGPPRRSNRTAVLWTGGAAVMLLAVLSLPIGAGEGSAGGPFVDEFRSVDDAAMRSRGWTVHARNEAYWARRGEVQDHLTLFTLRGDNWPKAGDRPAIQNLLLRRVPEACFVAEVQLSDFYPTENWQQAGLLFLEDSSLTGKSLRVSFAYNDYAGGFPGPREIIVQAITSGIAESDRPEEIAHLRLFELDERSDSLVRANLVHGALRIERKRDGYRLLYSTGAMANAAFREVVKTSFALRTRYVGLFAIKGFDDQAADEPVRFDSFSLASLPCAE